MPFSSLIDPVALARAHAAYQAALQTLKASGRLQAQERGSERLRYIVASLTPVAIDEDELANAAVKRFLAQARVPDEAG